MSANVIMYESPACPFCRAARVFFEKRSINFESILVDSRDVFDEMVKRSGRDSVPQIFIGDHHVGGYDDLVELDMDDGLEPLLQP